MNYLVIVGSAQDKLVKSKLDTTVMQAMKKMHINSIINIMTYPILVSKALLIAANHFFVSYTLLKASVRYMTEPDMMMDCIIHEGGEAIRCSMYRNIMTTSRNAV